MAAKHLGAKRRVRKRDHSKPPLNAPTLTCVGCGGSFRPKAKDRNRFCTRECAFAHHHLRNYRPRGRRTPPPPRPARKCRRCGSEIERTSKLLCVGCAERPATSRRRPKVTRPCAGCGVAVTGRAHIRRCQPCARRRAKDLQKAKHGKVKKHRQRARQFGVEYEPINPMAVFDRDKWCCQICGTKTPKKLRGSFEPNAPELDHRIPMALGGPHTWANVQCACRKCNIAKGGKKILGQLQLFDAAA